MMRNYLRQPFDIYFMVFFFIFYLFIYLFLRTSLFYGLKFIYITDSSMALLPYFCFHSSRINPLFCVGINIFVLEK